MNKEDFKIITDVLETKLETLDKILGPITENSPIDHITVGQLKEIKSKSAQELLSMTNILMVDLYHIIGMGNLSAMQLGKLTKLIKTYANYRPDLKAVVKWDGNINTLPKIPKRCKFKLLEFDLELVSGREGEIEEISETVNEYTDKVKTTAEGLGLTNESHPGTWNADTKDIHIPKLTINEFIAYIKLHKFFKVVSEANLKKYITNGGEYCGIVWYAKDDEVIGHPTNENGIKVFEELYK